jgi:predicted metal-dependent HD superfamily phosphohydrolase
MRDRWLTFCRRLDAPPGGLFDRLRLAYTEPHRFYHTLEHIDRCLVEFDAARDLPEHPDEVEMAIWFHDAVYDPRARDNEERSAEMAVGAALEMGLPPEFAARARDLVLSTRHDRPPQGIDAQVLADVDLSILGQPSLIFDEYELQIRGEYAWVPEPFYRAERARILQLFLDRPSIYSTDFFRDRYEGQARRNLGARITPK